MENAELSNVEKMIICLPFAGFYESVHDRQLDDAQERDAEHLSSKDNDSYLEAVGMDESDLNEVLFEMADWSNAHDVYATWAWNSRVWKARANTILVLIAFSRISRFPLWK
jgi:hypothetical protein